MTEELKLEGYCFKCREKRTMEQTKAEWASNGTPGTRGVCSVCGGTIYKTGNTPAHEGLPKPEIKPRAKKKKKAKGKRGKKKKRTRRSGKLVVVESPAKARTIGRYLGKGYKVMSSVGHVRDLLKSRLSVDVENDFEPEYRVPNEKRKTVKELAAAAAKATEIYLATDPDREGEAIAWHVMESAEMEPERTKRVVFQEITKPAIIAAFDHPREIDMERVQAQQTRRILDRLVGYQLSPLLWRKVRGRLSAGRVQSVAVRLVMEREREIDDFEKEEYWTIGAEISQQKYKKDNPRSYFQSKLHKIDGETPVLNSEEVVQPHVEQLEKADWTVHAVRLGKRTRRPAAPFTTSTMQQEASRKINFGTNKTMRIAQQLYEGIDVGEENSVGLITYMRTDSVTVSKDAQAEARNYIVDAYDADHVPQKPPVYKTRSKSAQEAHEAVRPTSVMRTPAKVKKYLKRAQFRLYELIWLRFVASQMSPAIYDTVSVDIMAGKKEVPTAKRPYLFRSAGSTLRFAGFLALYEETEPEDKPEDDDTSVPSDLTKDEVLDLMKLLPEQHFTQPPPRFSEATLVKELEENGIGRPSTYASIISTIQSRGYVAKDEKRLVPTDIGELVTDMLVEYFPNVMSVDFTARMEDDLDKVAEGKPWLPVMNEFYGRFTKNLAHADEAIEKVDINREPELVGRDCPTCGNPLVFRESRYGRFIGCSTFPSCRFTERIIVKIGVDCPLDGGDLIEKRTRKGSRLFFGCANYPECEWMSWKRPLPEPCPLCSGLQIQVNRKFSECTQCGERQPLPDKEEAEKEAV